MCKTYKVTYLIIHKVLSTKNIDNALRKLLSKLCVKLVQQFSEKFLNVAAILILSENTVGATEIETYWFYVSMSAISSKLTASYTFTHIALEFAVK